MVMDNTKNDKDKKVKIQPKFDNDQLGENPAEGRMIKEGKTDKKRK